MFTGIKHTHVLAVSIFLLIYIIKTFLLLTGKKNALDKFSRKTRVLEMVFSTLFVLSGIYLALNSGLIRSGYWFWFKLFLVAVSIPIGILAYKNKKKMIGLLVLVIYIYVFGVSETHSIRFNKDDIYGSPIELNANAGPMEHGQAIYNKYCSLCHGQQGDAQLEAASDLTQSDLTAEETLLIISDGRKSMKAFKNRLSSEEIKLVRDYVLSLRSN